MRASVRPSVHTFFGRFQIEKSEYSKGFLENPAHFRYPSVTLLLQISNHSDLDRSCVVWRHIDLFHTIGTSGDLALHVQSSYFFVGIAGFSQEFLCIFGDFLGASRPRDGADLELLELSPRSTEKHWIYTNVILDWTCRARSPEGPIV